MEQGEGSWSQAWQRARLRQKESAPRTAAVRRAFETGENDNVGRQDYCNRANADVIVIETFPNNGVRDKVATNNASLWRSVVIGDRWDAVCVSAIRSGSFRRHGRREASLTKPLTLVCKRR